MSSASPSARVLVVILLLAAGGCGEGAKTTKQARPQKRITPATVDAEAAVVVDGGRITVAPPVGWKREPRSKDYVARFLPGGGRSVPSLTVLGADPPAGITAVDEGNHGEFVKAVSAALAETFSNPDGKSTLLKKPAAVELGPHRAVVWEAPGTAKVGGLSQPIERGCAAVVVAGRMYTVEARAPKLDDDARAAARGVAAGIAAAPAEEPEPAGEPDGAAPEGGNSPEEPPAAQDPPAPQEAPAAG